MTFPVNSNQGPTGGSPLFPTATATPTAPAVPAAPQTATIPVDTTTLSPAATAVQPPAVPMSTASAGGLGAMLNSLFGAIGKMLSGIAGFVRRLFSAPPTQPTATQPGALPGATSTVPAGTTPVTTTPVTTTPVTTTPVTTTPVVTTPTTTPVTTTPVTTTPVTTTPVTTAPTTTTTDPTTGITVTVGDPAATTPATTTPVTDPAATSTPVVTTPTPTTTTPTTTTTPAPAAGALTAEELQMAQAQGIQATRENFDAFIKEAQGLEAVNALGPGSTQTDSITELQQVLAGFGYPVTANGQFDQATVDAVVKFKKDNNLTATYKMADGTPGVHPFIDDATKNVMIAKLTAATPAPTTPAPATTTTPVTTTPVTTTPATPDPATTTPVVTTPVTTPGTQYQATPLSAEETQIATQQGIQATRENFDAFMKEAQALEAANAMGPGSTDKDAITELQQVLAGFGYPVTATGAYDQATIDAVLKFKKDNNLTATYKMADGTPGVHPFIDDATKNVMLTKLGAAPAATTPVATPVTTPATTTTPVTTTPVTTTPATPVTTPPVVTTPATQYQAAPLSAEETQIATQQGIQATRENFDAFMKEAQALEAANAVGPGSADKDAVTELQQVLTSFGYPVTATGAFDQPTIDAVLKFKRDNNLVSTYKLADGTPGVHPFIDDATKNVMLAKLGAAPAATTPAPATATVPTPAAPAQYQAVGLSAADKETAEDNGLLATTENVAAFTAEATALQAQIPVGPGTVDKEATSELQQVLTSLGYPVAVTGEFNAETEAAVLKFKRDNNLYASYKLADGTQAVHPYIDQATKNVLIAKLGG